MVYFINEDGTNNYKIGYTLNGETLNRRLRTLQTGNSRKLTISKVVDGDLYTELKLHSKFNEYRIDGEWFSLNDFEKIDLSTDNIDHVSRMINYIDKKLDECRIVMRTLESINGSVDRLDFLKAMNISNNAAKKYIDILKHEFTINNNSSKGLEFGRQLKSKRMDANFDLTEIWIDKTIALRKPIMVYNLQKELNVSRNTAAKYLLRFKDKIDEYHKSYFLGTNNKMVQARYELCNKILNNVDVNKKQTYLEISNILGIHINSLFHHKDYIKYKFPNLIS